ncbi:hypothetical protein KXX06_006700, partial [Aspergillus fumigatus]
RLAAHKTLAVRPGPRPLSSDTETDRTLAGRLEVEGAGKDPQSAKTRRNIFQSGNDKRLSGSE